MTNTATHLRDAQSAIDAAYEEYDGDNILVESILEDLRNTVSEMASNVEAMEEPTIPEDTKVSRHAIIGDLREGRRHPICDADRLQRSKTLPKGFEAVHLGSDGSITLNYELERAVESTEAGGVYDFDLVDESEE